MPLAMQAHCGHAWNAGPPSNQATLVVSDVSGGWRGATKESADRLAVTT
jgi:hypothetical protein